MHRSRTLVTCLAVAALTTGCFMLRPAPEEKILGRWKTELAGFPVVVEYTPATVGIGSYPPVDYTLDGDVIEFQFDGVQRRRVAFTSDDVMVQTDLTTGIERTFVRETE